MAKPLHESDEVSWIGILLQVVTMWVATNVYCVRFIGREPVVGGGGAAVGSRRFGGGICLLSCVLLTCFGTVLR